MFMIMINHNIYDFAFAAQFVKQNCDLIPFNIYIHNFRKAKNILAK